jgi:hypothetical protein
MQRAVVIDDFVQHINQDDKMLLSSPPSSLAKTSKMMTAMMTTATDIDNEDK